MDAGVLAKQLETKWAADKVARTQRRGAKDAIPAAELASAKETAKESPADSGGTTDASKNPDRDTASDAMQADMYPAALAADKAWSDELVRMFGKASGDARYDARGYSTTKLKELKDAKLAADRALFGR